MKPVIAITLGDFNGIGPEVILKSIISPSIKGSFSPILVGSFDIFSFYAKKFKIKISLKSITDFSTPLKGNEIPVITVHSATSKNISLGSLARNAGMCAGLSIEKAALLCLQHKVSAMVTAPVSKKALHLAGYNFPGQTEMLTTFTRSEHVTMMLMSTSMRVALATVHIPIKNVSKNLTTQNIVEQLITVQASLKKDFGINSPSIAVLGLNPHAGENGEIGIEEKAIIVPAIAKAKQKKINVSGPFPADGFFALYDPKKYDAILAMYHDQGLIPLKMTGFDEGVNFSAGLKIIRTSPDHGTAFDIAGKGIANPGSTISAIQTAIAIAKRWK